MENIGRKLQIIRELHNLTQEQVASKIGLTQVDYAQLEQKNEVEMQIIEQIAEEVYQIEPQKIIQLPTDPKIFIQNIYDSQVVGTATNVTFNQDKKTGIFEEDLEKIKVQIEFLLSIFDNQNKK